MKLMEVFDYENMKHNFTH